MLKSCHRLGSDFQLFTFYGSNDLGLQRHRFNTSAFDAKHGFLPARSSKDAMEERWTSMDEKHQVTYDCALPPWTRISFSPLASRLHLSSLLLNRKFIDYLSSLEPIKQIETFEIALAPHDQIGRCGSYSHMVTEMFAY